MPCIPELIARENNFATFYDLKPTPYSKFALVYGFCLFKLCFVLFFFYLYLSEFFLHDFLTWWYKQYFSVNISFTEVQFSKSLSQVTCQRFPRCGSVKFKVFLNCLPPSFRLKFSLTLLIQILLPLTPLELQGNLALNWKKINRI